MTAEQGRTLRIQFRANPDDVRRLRALARRWETTESEALRRALREAHSTENANGKANVSGSKARKEG
jgi:hypothetical protein